HIPFLYDPDVTHDRPVIGLTAYEEKATWGVWDAELAAIVPATYVHAVLRAGGLPVLLPVQSKGASELVARVDGIVLVGGPDVDPRRYGEEAHPETQTPRLGRDTFEFAVLEEATKLELPTLAICRGLQALNVFRGGSLHQHLPDVEGRDVHGQQGDYEARPVRIEAESRLADALGSDKAEAMCHHHQAVDVVGEDLVPVAWAEDGTIEALEDPNLPFLIAVQWHPEVGTDGAIFQALVKAASGEE
ncbi:MAG TPA: gamma-glutamyl-gamma-aminobutyrate hydrolase family protein, partial [Acidimicrobiales bacterium]|nr:gamma-glutamyl-gamma-aminobutyrate hydrolase family protein [Acidimicrobiales bacterium]